MKHEIFLARGKYSEWLKQSNLSVTCILYRRKVPEQLNNSVTKCICYTYQIPSKCINSAKIEPLKFRPLLLKVSFSRPFQLMKINSTESYVFFLARTYRARIQLSFTNTRGIQYSPYVNPYVSPYRVLNLTLGTKYKYTIEHQNWHFKRAETRQ